MYGDEINSSGSYTIPSGTKGEVLEWHRDCKTAGGKYAEMQMFNSSKIKILNGPLKGKILMINHMYINLDD